MTFKRVFEACKDAPLHVGRNFLRAQVLAASGINDVKIMKTSLDPAVNRGFYFSPRNTTHPIVAGHGQHLVVVARALNRCWTRFVVAKELMHLLDGAESATDTGEAFDGLLGELHGQQGTSQTRSPQLQAEIACFWKALACLCPEAHRKQFAAERAKNHIDDYGIALKLRIPQQYVPNLFEPYYEKQLEGLLK